MTGLFLKFWWPILWISLCEHVRVTLSQSLCENSTSNSSNTTYDCLYIDVTKASIKTGAFGFSVQFPYAVNFSSYNATVTKLTGETGTELTAEEYNIQLKDTENKIIFYGLEPVTLYEICLTPLQTPNVAELTNATYTHANNSCFNGTTLQSYRYEQRSVAIGVFVAMLVIVIVLITSDTIYDVLYKTKFLFFGIMEIPEETPANTVYRILEDVLKLENPKVTFLFQKVYWKRESCPDGSKPLVVKVSSGREARKILLAATGHKHVRARGNKLMFNLQPDINM